MSKRCPKCGETKETSAFYRNATQSDGLQAWCSSCLRVAVRAKASTIPEPTRTCRVCRIEQDVKNFGTDPRVADGLTRRCNTCAAEARKRRDIHERDRPRQYKTEQYRETSRQSSLRYLARKAGAKGAFTLEEWQETLEDFNHRCAYCHKPSKRLHQEHMKALSRGGDDSRDNIVPACASCNSRKGTKPLVEFLVECSKS